MFILLQLLAAFTADSAGSDELVIACVGDSLTSGVGSTGENHTNAYPAALKRNPKFSGYAIHNFGDGGKCAIKSTGTNSYWKTKKYAKAMASNPNIVVLMLGTNDAKEHHWNDAAYREDLADMIKGFQNLSSKPTVYLGIPPPVYSTKHIYMIQPDVVNVVLPRIIPLIAKACNVKTIDIFEAFGGTAQNYTKAYRVTEAKPMGEWPNDGVHFSDFGYSVLADNVAKVLLADRP